MQKINKESYGHANISLSSQKQQPNNKKPSLSINGFLNDYFFKGKHKETSEPRKQIGSKTSSNIPTSIKNI